MGRGKPWLIFWRLHFQNPVKHDAAAPVEVWTLHAIVAGADCKLDVLKPGNCRTI